MAKKKFFWICFLMIYIIIFIKIVFGVIQINSDFQFQGPGYNIFINDIQVASLTYSKKEVKLIPYLVHYNSSHSVISQGEEVAKVKLGDQVKISVSPYRCFSTAMGTKNVSSCTHDNSGKIIEDMKEDGYSIYSMHINGGTNYGLTGKKVYKGEYMSDITHLLKNKAKYVVHINVEYENVESEIEIIVDMI